MAKSRKKKYSENASKMQVSMGNVLREGVFSGFESYQEYPVKEINPLAHNISKLKVDWVIPSMRYAIELMGKQHFEFTPFFHETKEDFKAAQQRDMYKQVAIEQAGWVYITFRYDEDINEANLLSKINNFEPTYAYETGKTERPRQDPKHKERLQKAKEYRKKKYQFWKKRKQDEAKNRRS